MSNEKKYRLLKNINSFELTANAGDIGIRAGSEKYDENCKVWFDNHRYYFYLKTILQYHDWFEVVEPLPEKDFVWTDELVLNYLRQIGEIPFDVDKTMNYFKSTHSSTAQKKEPAPTKERISSLDKLFAPKKEAEDIHRRDWRVEELFFKGEFLEVPNAKLCSDGLYRNYGDGQPGCTLEKCLETKWQIHSVRRLSDMRVFQIDNEVNWNAFGLGVVKITRFSIESGELKVWHNSYSQTLSDELKKLPQDNKTEQKEVLFTTEDGVEIREGHDERVYFVVEGSWVIGSAKTPKKPFEGVPEHPIKYFSTQEKAKDYVLMNKPCLSVNDVIPIWAGHSYFPMAVKELAESKTL